MKRPITDGLRVSAPPRQSYGDCIGGHFHGSDMGHWLQMREPSHDYICIPKRFKLREEHYPRAPIAVTHDTYLRRTDNLGNTFWLHNSLLSPGGR